MILITFAKVSVKGTDDVTPEVAAWRARHADHWQCDDAWDCDDGETPQPATFTFPLSK